MTNFFVVLLFVTLTEQVLSAVSSNASVNASRTIWTFSTANATPTTTPPSAKTYNNTLGPRAVVLSPDFPNNYGPNIDCNWTIQAQKDGKQPIVTMSSLEIEKSPNCTKDWVEVRNGDSESSPPFPHSHYCGRLEDLEKKLYGRANPVKFVANNSVWVRFVSDSSTDTLRGFLLTLDSGSYRDITDRPPIKTEGNTEGNQRTDNTPQIFPMTAIYAIISILALLVLGIAIRYAMKKLKKKKQDEEKVLALSAWEVPLNTIVFEKKLGHGAHGVVWKGRFTEIPEWMKQSYYQKMQPGNTLQIAVKTIHEETDEDAKMEFLREIGLMKDVGHHRNIVNMLACCVRADPPLLIMEFVAFGDLLRYLRERRSEIAGKEKKYSQYYEGRMNCDQNMGSAESRYKSLSRLVEVITGLEGKEKESETVDGKCITEATSADEMMANLDDEDRVEGHDPDKSTVVGLSKDDLKERQKGGEETKEKVDKNANGCNEDIEKHGRVTLVQGDEKEMERDKDFKIAKEEKERERDSKDDEEEDKYEEEELVPGDLLSFAWQIARGMEYLSDNGYVHRDLAARNVFVGHGKVAKVADFGLTREIGNEVQMYHCKNKRKLPIRWMSPEAIFDMVFTTKSDVWSFGIVLWEIITVGGAPYPSVGNFQLSSLLKHQYRMEKPEFCSDEIYDLMMKCWDELPAKRPTFTELVRELEILLSADKNYLDLTNIEDTPEYMTIDGDSEEEFGSQLGTENIPMSFIHKSFEKDTSL